MASSRAEESAHRAERAIAKGSKLRTDGWGAYTTENDVHGFGLHSAVLMAKEMGSSLTARSQRGQIMHAPRFDKNRRILVIDDNRAIHDDLRKILVADGGTASPLQEKEAALFGDAAETASSNDFEVDSAYQGQEGLELVRRAIRAERPYAMAFVDVRMPPGWDGIETTTRLWQEDPDLQVVICTAYSDYTWAETVEKLRETNRFLILKKRLSAIPS